jgi:hypothetical protein
MPGVAGVAMTEALPLSPSQTVVTVVPEGYQFPKGREKTIEFGAAVDGGYFSALHVVIESGRAFTDHDREGSRRVAIVNREFANTYWPNQDAIGKRIRLDERGRPRGGGGRRGEDRALPGGERDAGSVRVSALRAESAPADDAGGGIGGRRSRAGEALARCRAID